MTKKKQKPAGQDALPAIAPTVDTFKTEREPWAGQKYSPLSRLTENVYIGDYVDGRDLALHEEHGIDAIVNCTNEPHPHEHVTMLCLMQRDHTGLDWDKLDQFFAFMDEQVAAGRTVLIHCALGINRAPTFATAWVMRERAWTWARAFAFVRFRRRIAWPDEAQEGTVTEYIAARYPGLVLVDDGNR